MLPILVVVAVVVVVILFFVMRGNKPTSDLTDSTDATNGSTKSSDKKPDPKPETKPEKKPDPKSEAKPERKPETKPEKKPEAKPEPKAEVAAQGGTDAKTGSETPGTTSETTRDPGTEAPRAGDLPAASAEAKPAGEKSESTSAASESLGGTSSVSTPAQTPGSSRKRTDKQDSAADVLALRKGLAATRSGWVQKLVGLFGGKKEIDPELLQMIEETLLSGDVGVKTTQRLIDTLKERLGKKDLSDDDVVWAGLREIANEILGVASGEFGKRAKSGEPLVILVVGVNGVGKTTTIGKLAARYKEAGKKVYLAAGDTFRAAAVSQLEAWGKRVGVSVVKGKDLSKPSAVVFDAVQTALKEGADVVLADTAGRLHTKTPLMDELRKLKDAAGKALPGAPHEILLVLDATTGQNGLIQVKEFREALDLTGIILTKLDGTARGGVILGICDEFKLPVRYVGVGEKVDDLREFDHEDFAEALFERPAAGDQVA